jgi:hypothetical protein
MIESEVVPIIYRARKLIGSSCLLPIGHIMLSSVVPGVQQALAPIRYASSTTQPPLPHHNIPRQHQICSIDKKRREAA